MRSSAPGQLVRPAPDLGPEPHPLQHGEDPAAALGPGDARQQQRILDVLVGREDGNQVERLEDEADRIPPHARQRARRQVRDAERAVPDFARVRSIEAADQVEQRCLAAAGWPSKRGEVTLLDGQRHIAQCRHAGRAQAVGFRNTDDLRDRRHVILLGYCVDSAPEESLGNRPGAGSATRRVNRFGA
jgi:hypothetical protein